MTMRTGLPYWALDPRPGDVRIEDIAHGLARSCRYGGQCNRHYSVAEHSVRLCWIMRDAGYPLSVQFQALMHDSPEAYIVDVPRDVKPFLQNYRELEERNWFAIADEFGLPLVLHDEVEAADKAMPSREMPVLFEHLPKNWMHDRPAPSWMPKRFRFVGWPAWLAKMLFMWEFNRLYAATSRSKR